MSVMLFENALICFAVTKKPELTTCKLGVDGEDVRNSTSGHTSGCEHEQDTFINFQPQFLFFNFEFDFGLPKFTRPSYIDDAAFGITGGNVLLQRKGVNGS